MDYMECCRKVTTLSKAQQEKPECLKNTRTDPPNNKNNLSGFQDACSSMTEKSGIKLTEPSKTGIF